MVYLFLVVGNETIGFFFEDWTSKCELAWPYTNVCLKHYTYKNFDAIRI